MARSEEMLEQVRGQLGKVDAALQRAADDGRRAATVPPRQNSEARSLPRSELDLPWNEPRRRLHGSAAARLVTEPPDSSLDAAALGLVLALVGRDAAHEETELAARVHRCLNDRSQARAEELQQLACGVLRATGILLADDASTALATPCDTGKGPRAPLFSTQLITTASRGPAAAWFDAARRTFPPRPTSPPFTSTARPMTTCEPADADGGGGSAAPVVVVGNGHSPGAASAPTPAPISAEGCAGMPFSSTSATAQSISALSGHISDEVKALAEVGRFDDIAARWGDAVKYASLTWVWNISQTLPFTPELFQLAREGRFGEIDERCSAAVVDALYCWVWFKSDEWAALRAHRTSLLSGRQARTVKHVNSVLELPLSARPTPTWLRRSDPHDRFFASDSQPELSAEPTGPTPAAMPAAATAGPTAAVAAALSPRVPGSTPAAPKRAVHPGVQLQQLRTARSKLLADEELLVRLLCHRNGVTVASGRQRPDLTRLPLSSPVLTPGCKRPRSWALSESVGAEPGLTAHALVQRAKANRTRSRHSPGGLGAGNGTGGDTNSQLARRRLASLSLGSMFHVPPMTGGTLPVTPTCAVGPSTQWVQAWEDDLQLVTGPVAWADIVAEVSANRDRALPPPSSGPSSSLARSWSVDVKAPTFRECAPEDEPAGSGSEAGEEEDISDESFLARHDAVLAKMKARIGEIRQECGVAVTSKRKRKQGSDLA